MKRILTVAAAVSALAGAGFALAALTATKNVNITRTGFVPKTVTIAGGDTVRWKNVDTVNHQVVANSGAFASPLIAPNKTYSKRLDTPGTYPYRDALYPTRRGTVKVTGPPPSISIAASVPIATYGNQIHVGGAVSPAAVGDTVVLEAQPWGQLSFAEVGRVETTTNGVWDLVVTPTILTSYKATWKGKTSAVIQVAVAPRLTLMRSRGWFVTRAKAGRSLARHWVYAQRLNGFGQWVTLRKVYLNRQSARRFRLRLSRRSRIRTFLTTNQAGSGYIFSTSNTVLWRSR